MVDPLFLFWDAAEKAAIGTKLYYHAKAGSFRDSLEFRLFVCYVREKEKLKSTYGKKWSLRWLCFCRIIFYYRKKATEAIIEKYRNEPKR